MHRPLHRRELLSLAAVAMISMAAVTAVSSAGSPPALRLQAVKVIDAKTVEATFSNPLAAKTTNVSLRVFHAPDWDWDVPHSHEATSVTLLNAGRTARVTLDRGLHADPPPCDTSEPRCSDDELPFVVRKATDVYGQVISDSDWEVWAIGSDR